MQKKNSPLPDPRDCDGMTCECGRGRIGDQHSCYEQALRLQKIKEYEKYNA